MRRSPCLPPELGPLTCEAPQAEVAYVAERKVEALVSFKAYLGSLASTVYGGNLDTLNSSVMPTLALAVSGGSERASLYGAGVLATLNGQNPMGKIQGLSGLLQSTSYVSALSG